MKHLIIVTGNNNKFIEIQRLLPNAVRSNVKLDEVQSLDIEEIAEKKVKAAAQALNNYPYILVEDVGLNLNCLNGFPGPLIKFFLEKQSLEEIYRLAESKQDYKATWTHCIAFYFHGKIWLYTQSMECDLANPDGIAWGFDPLLKPYEQSKTIGSMSIEEKENISPRTYNLNCFIDRWGHLFK